MTPCLDYGEPTLYLDMPISNEKPPVFEKGTGDSSAVLINASHPNTASGVGSFALGAESVASGVGSLAMGTYSRDNKTTASGNCSIALGIAPTASGNYSQAFGSRTQAKSNMSSAFGYYTVANGRAAMAIGQFNIEDNSEIDASHGTGARKYIFTVGNGTADDARSNAMTVDWYGNVELSGNLKIGNTVITEAQLIQLLAMLQ